MAVSQRSNENPPVEELSFSRPSPARVTPEVRDSTYLIGDSAPGVKRIQLISSQMHRWDRFFLFFSIFFLASAYSMDGTLRSQILAPIAASMFQSHPLLGTINTVTTVVGAAAQPIIAKITDVFGRLELVLLSVVLYSLGTIAQSTAGNLAVFCVGSVLWNLGWVIIILLVELIISDITSLRSRVLFSYIPALPLLVNSWLSGDVFDVSQKHISWRWSVGIWGIIYAGCALPFMLILWSAQRRAKANIKFDLAHYRTPAQRLGWHRLIVLLFWQLDIIGMILLALALGLTLTPMTIVRAKQVSWSDPSIIVPLICGVICMPIFIFWENNASYPMVPFQLLKDRAIWGALGIAVTFNAAFAVENEYLFSVLRIGYATSYKSTARILNFYNFTSVLTGAAVGVVIYKIRYLRPFIIVGTMIYFAAFALLIVFNGGASSRAHYGVVGGQILLGIGGGMFPYPAMASIQATTQHEHLAAMTGLYLAIYRVGSAVGSCIAAVIYNHVLQRRLLSRLDTIKASLVEDRTFTYATMCVGSQICPFSEADRLVAIEAFKYMQRVLCTVGAAICVPLILFTFTIRNPRLGDEQSFSNIAEVYELHPPPIRVINISSPSGNPQRTEDQKPPSMARSAIMESALRDQEARQSHTPLSKDN